MITVYTIRSVNKLYIYVGQTNNLQRRVDEHNAGKGRSTKPYAPFVLIFSETHPNRIQSRAREKFLKSGQGKIFLRSLK
jgi:putative endonuclease